MRRICNEEGVRTTRALETVMIPSTGTKGAWLDEGLGGYHHESRATSISFEGMVTPN